MNAASPSVLAQREYLRQRACPRPGDEVYLHLSDLLEAMRAMLPPHPRAALDYGCGGSPYRELVGARLFHRADLPGQDGLDFTLQEIGRVPSPDGAYDLVISTQVLEHVREPLAYLRECHRLLAPGGRLLLSTHGLFHEHACPFDFYRWTAAGLSGAFNDAGFSKVETWKLTTGPRALVFFNQLHTRHLLPKQKGLVSWLIRLSRLPYSRLDRARLDRWCDLEWPQHRMVNAQEPGHEFYVGVIACGQKPAL